jgi:hypothetical protein
MLLLRVESAGLDLAMTGLFSKRCSCMLMMLLILVILANVKDWAIINLAYLCRLEICRRF